MEPKQQKQKVISNQSLTLSKSKIQTNIHTDKDNQKILFARNYPKNNKTKTIRLNIFAFDNDDQDNKLHSKSLKNPQKLSIKRLSTNAMSARQSFVKSITFSKHKHQQTSSYPKPKSVQNFKPKRLKTNPEEMSTQRKCSPSINLSKCISCKKIKDFVDQQRKKETMRNVHQKLKGKSSKKWQQRYLKKRVQSFSKISQTINKISQLLSIQSSLKIKRIFQDEQAGSEGNMFEKQKVNKKDSDDSQSEDSRSNDYEKYLNQKDLIQPKLNLQVNSSLKKTFNLTTRSGHNTTGKKFYKKNQLHSFHKTHSCFMKKNDQSKSLKKNELSSLNISQFFGTGLNANCTKQASQFKLQRETVYSNFKKHKAHSINTLSLFQATILKGKRNKKDGEESLIHELRERRTAEKLAKEPKQWHFYNLTGLNKIELYETKLNVSAESWLAMDCLEMKYLRGWKVKKQSEKTLIALRLGIFKCFESLSNNKSIDLKKIRVRVNYQNIQNKVTFITNNKMTIRNRNLMEQGYALRNHTIISIEGLLIGLCRIQGCWDIIFWLIQFCGYLHLKVQQMNGTLNELLYDEVIYFKNDTDLDFYESTFFDKFMKIVEVLQLQSTKIQIGYIHCPKIHCNLIDLGILFMSCMKFPSFYSICFNQISNDVPIRYQVGWNHWQSRIHSFKSSFHNKLNKFGTFGWLQQHFYQTSIDYVKNPKEQDLLIYQSHQKTLIIINAAKVNLGVSDVIMIDDWIGKTFKRFYKQSKESSKLCQTTNRQRQNIVYKSKSKKK